MPGLGAELPMLRSDLPGLRSDLPGLRSDLPGTSAPLSGQHLPPLRRLEICFPGRMQELADVVAPHSTKAAYWITPASAPRDARGKPLFARPAGLGHVRAAATAGETAEQYVSSSL